MHDATEWVIRMQSVNFPSISSTGTFIYFIRNITIFVKLILQTTKTKKNN